MNERTMINTSRVSTTARELKETMLAVIDQQAKADKHELPFFMLGEQSAETMDAVRAFVSSFAVEN